MAKSAEKAMPKRTTRTPQSWIKVASPASFRMESPSSRTVATSASAVKSAASMQMRARGSRNRALGFNNRDYKESSLAKEAATRIPYQRIGRLARILL